MPENNTINQKIKYIDISKIENITLLANNWDIIKIQTPNFYKIIILLIKNSWKTEFDANELSKTYDFVIENYESEIDKETFEKIKQWVNIFVQYWWKIEINYKKLDQVWRLLYWAWMIILVIVWMFLVFCWWIALDLLFPNATKNIFNPFFIIIIFILILIISRFFNNKK